MSEIYRADQIDQVLVDAINTKNCETVREILENCDDNFNILDINSQYGYTAFHHAANPSVADINIIKLLIDYAKNQCATTKSFASDADKVVSEFNYISNIINKKTRSDEYGCTAVDIIIGNNNDIAKLLQSVGGHCEEYEDPTQSFKEMYFNDDNLIKEEMYEDGSSYKGHFKNGEQKHGSGMMTFSDGSSFSGTWANGHIYDVQLHTVAFG